MGQTVRRNALQFMALALVLSLAAEGMEGGQGLGVGVLLSGALYRVLERRWVAQVERDHSVVIFRHRGWNWNAPTLYKRAAPEPGAAERPLVAPEVRTTR